MGSRAVLRWDPDLSPRDVSPAAPYLAAQRLRTRGCPGNRPAIQPLPPGASDDVLDIEWHTAPRRAHALAREEGATAAALVGAAA